MTMNSMMISSLFAGLIEFFIFQLNFIWHILLYNNKYFRNSFHDVGYFSEAGGVYDRRHLSFMV